MNNLNFASPFNLTETQPPQLPPQPTNYNPYYQNFAVDNFNPYEYYNYHQQIALDQSWINNWLVQKSLTKKPPEKPSSEDEKLTISGAQETLKKCCMILNRLKDFESDLKTNIDTISNMSWEQKLMEIDKQKAVLLNSLTSFDNAAMLTKLQKEIKKRKRKREYLKTKKIERRNQLTIVYNRRQQLHKSINQWLNEQKEQVEKVKRDEYLKRDADCVLSEVTKKKTDARRQLALLSSLIKLREVREKAASSRGEKNSLEDSNTFLTITERLKNMWQKALKSYTMEERGLRVMLDMKSKTTETKDDKNKKIIKEWSLALFGPTFVPSDAYWVLTCAERDLEIFIALRKSWDTFLTSPNNNQGSSIPIGWILPQNPSSQLWAKYLDNSA